MLFNFQQYFDMNDIQFLKVLRCELYSTANDITTCNVGFFDMPKITYRSSIYSDVGVSYAVDIRKSQCCIFFFWL